MCFVVDYLVGDKKNYLISIHTPGVNYHPSKARGRGEAGRKVSGHNNIILRQGID